eukprot:Nitzschia sp. Nitz4//scaffold62_size106224//38758//40146//NITZ4_004351-RA/size106224-processed-gene-0.28-mRNA-1//1//CDS//3329555841//4016//frame0
MSSYQDQQVQALALSISIQLNTLFPNELPGNEDPTLQKYLENLASTNGLDKQAALEAAMPLALSRWTGQKPQDQSIKNQLTSFSLLDQLQAGGFAFPPSIDEIIDTTDLRERLDKLNTIEYVEDLLSIWEELSPLLVAGLTSYDEALMDYSLASSYLRLHRKWFDQARSSPEYRSIQWGICGNLVQSIRQTIATKEGYYPNRAFFVRQVQTWREMFLDLLQRNEYSSHSEGILEIGVSYLLWLRSYPCKSFLQNMSTNLLSPTQCMALVDPRADCFESLAQRVTPSHLISVLTLTGLFVDIVACCQSSPPWTIVDSEASTQMDPSLYMYSLAILSLTLEKTRVSLFPWDLWTNTPVNSPVSSESWKDLSPFTKKVLGTSRYPLRDPSSDEVCRLFSVFLSPLSQQAPVSMWFRHVCYRAVETIVDGSRNLGEGSTILQHLQGKVEASNVHSSFLPKLKMVLS